jgi:two-component system OmpR family response regulator
MSNRRVLIIDDDPDMVELLATFLRHADWLPLVASNADEALAVAKLAKPNVILCDAVMSRVTGAQLIRRLKAHPETRAFPVIIMSGYDESIASDTVADGFLGKPFTLNEVLTEIESVVEKAPIEAKSNVHSFSAPHRPSHARVEQLLKLSDQIESVMRLHPV